MVTICKEIANALILRPNYLQLGRKEVRFRRMSLSSRNSGRLEALGVKIDNLVSNSIKLIKYVGKEVLNTLNSPPGMSSCSLPACWWWYNARWWWL